MWDVKMSDEQLLADLVSYCPEITGVKPTDTNPAAVLKKISE